MELGVSGEVERGGLYSGEVEVENVVLGGDGEEGMRGPSVNEEEFVESP